MTRSKAIEVYLKHSRMARKAIEQLIKYDPKKTQYENALVLKMTIGHLSGFSTKFGIRGKNSHMEAIKKSWNKRQLKLLKKWDKKCTITQNAKLIGVSIPTANNYVRKFDLKFAHHTATKPSVVARINRIMALKKKGVRNAEIARMFNYSRERIGQLVREAAYL